MHNEYSLCYWTATLQSNSFMHKYNYLHSIYMKIWNILDILQPVLKIKKQNALYSWYTNMNIIISMKYIMHDVMPHLY